MRSFWQSLLFWQSLRRYLAGFLWLALVILPPAAWPQAAEPQDWPDIFPPKPQVRLIAAQTAIGQGRIEAGVHIRLGSAWKTYAKNPGETGIAPKFLWSESENLKSAQVRFPQPKRIKVFSSELIGYQDEVIFPVIVNVKDRTRPLHLRLDLSYAICADLCIPLREQLHLTLAPGRASASADAPHINRFIDKLPK